MSDYQAVYVSVRRVAEKCSLTPEDKGVSGTYSVQVARGLKPCRMASAALDAFHENVAIDDLDAFEITVVDPVSGIAVEQDGGAEAYSMGRYARDVNYIGKTLRSYVATMSPRHGHAEIAVHAKSRAVALECLESLRGSKLVRAGKIRVKRIR